MRKKVEAGAVDVVSRVRTVKAQDYQSKSSAHRALIGGGWEGARSAREAALAKRLAASPTDPLKLRPLTIALFVTRHRASIRQWARVESLIQQVNVLFEPARIEFLLTEPAEFTRSVSFASRCPFEGDLDHEYEWMHLAMVPKLPEDQPVLPACGRCALISDRCPDQLVAEALARMLGLESGPEFSWPQIQWLRWQAWLLQGQPVPLPLVRVPLWCFQVTTPEAYHSQRHRAEVAELLERANLYWLQAGVAFEMVRWCPLTEHHCSAELWGRATSGEFSVLEPLTGGRALNLFFVKERGAAWTCLPDVAHRLVLLRDELWRDPLPERRLAQALGTLLGLLDVSGEDQLMCPYTQGTRISPAEAGRVRRRADVPADQSVHEMLLGQISVTEGCELARLELRVNLFLVRGHELASRTSLEDARLWLERVNWIWGQAGITVVGDCHEVTVNGLEAALPNPLGAPSQRKASCAGLQKAAGYDPGRLNLFVVHQLPIFGRPDQFGSYTSWPAARVVLLAECVDWHSADKQLALALAVGLGQKASASGAFDELLTSRSPGLRLTAEQAMALRAGLTGGSVEVYSQVTIPVTLHEAGTQAGLLLEKANFFWAQAGLRWQLKGRQGLPDFLEPAGLQAHAQAGSLNLFFAPEATPQCFRDRGLLVANGDLVAALGDFLNVKTGSLTATEITWARAQASLFKEVLEPGLPAASLTPLSLPLRLHLVRNARYGWEGQQDWGALVAGAGEILACAQIVPQLRGCQEVSLPDAAIESALPGELKAGSFAGLTGIAGYDAGALNLFIGAAGSALFAQDKPARALLLRGFSTARPLARALAGFLEVAPNDFSGPESLRGGGGGTGLTPLEIERMREAVLRTFPAVKFSFAPAGPAVLPLKLRLAGEVAGTPEQLLAGLLGWNGLEVRLVVGDRVDIPEVALREACPGPGKMPMHFKLMTLPGYDPRALNVLVVDALPVGEYAVFPLAKTVLTRAGNLQAALEELLGSDPAATARRLFPLG